MLQQFKVPETDAIRVPLAALETTVQRVFAHLGVGENEATLAAEVLVNADLRGVDSHGVSNQLNSYIKGYGDGSINPLPNWKIVRESSGTATIDCDRGLGLYSHQQSERGRDRYGHDAPRSSSWHGRIPRNDGIKTRHDRDLHDCARTSRPSYVWKESEIGDESDCVRCSDQT